MADPINGEVANALAAGNIGIPFTLALAANTSIETLSKRAPNTIKWFQMFIMCDPELTKKLVSRAERAGFKAIVVTIDFPVLGCRRSDMRNNFTLPDNLKWENLIDEIEVAKLNMGTEDLDIIVGSLLKPNTTWKDIKWLKSITKIPIILKGILSPEDALLAVECKVDGIIVSNHGGRHMDSFPPAVIISFLNKNQVV